MKMCVKTVLLLLAVFCVTSPRAEDLEMGTSINGILAYTENVSLKAIPFASRTKNVFYNDNSSRIIKGIWAVDRDRSQAKVAVTSGGVGSSFVNVRIKSERGDGLDYQVQVFV